MKIYLDDSRADRALAGLLRKAGHSVVRPSDVGLFGVSDARHFEWAIVKGNLILTADRVDFRELHQLVVTAGGHHPGVLVVRYSNDPKKDMRVTRIVKAVNKLANSGLSTANQVIVLNQWR